MNVTIQTHNSDDQYPNATSCEILANGVLRVENNGEVMQFSPSYWHKVTTKA